MTLGRAPVVGVPGPRQGAETMAALEIEVPPEQRDDLLRELLAYYAVKADAVRQAVEHHLEGQEPLDSVAERRAELAAVEALVEQLGWELGAAAGPGSLKADRDLLTAIAHGALIVAVEDLANALESVQDRAEVERLASQLGRVAGLFELVRIVSAV